MSFCLLGLGSNLGDRSQQLELAIRQLQRATPIRVLAESRKLETKPVGGPKGQAAFLNAAVLIETSESPTSLLARTQSIERRAGRSSSRRWDARPIDIDLLLYDDLTMRTAQLVLPHPWLAVRRFVLEPAMDVAADLRHPQLGWTIKRMFEHLRVIGQRFVVTRSRFDDKVPRICQELGAEYVPDPIGDVEFDSARSPVPARQQPIEFVHWRRRALVDSGWCQTGADVICKFWLGADEAAAKAIQTEIECPELLGDVGGQAAAIPPPKLLIYCRPDAVFLDNQNGALDNVDGQWDELRAAICRAGSFPWLEIEISDEIRFRDEIIAAFRSMR